MIQNKRLTYIFISTAFMILIPWVAMQFTNDVHWTLSDFIIAGVLLLGTGLVCEFAMRKVKTRKNKIALIIMTIAVLLLIWVELAVGVFGTPIAGS
jgi:heme/copper-type cytochrome/quinol oxidase subunit 3